MGRSSFRTLSLALGAVLLLGCSAANERPLGASSGGAGGSAAGSGGGTGGVSIEAGADAGDAGADECTNVDILFVVDNSGSMADNQLSLIQSFPGFVAAIQQRLAFAESYHVGVVTTDAYAFNQPACTAIGDLVTQTGGPKSSAATCGPFASGKRFLDQTEPDLASKFACAAQVGASGSDDERAARAMLDALSPVKNAPGGCNDGFSRLDSLLIVVLITDEDDVPDQCGGNPYSSCGCETCGSGGSSSTWYDEIVSYKGGIAENIVVLSLLGQKLDNTCGAMPAAKLIGFTNKFGANGYTDDVCAASYDQFFDDVLPVIDTACQNYVPPIVK